MMESDFESVSDGIVGRGAGYRYGIGVSGKFVNKPYNPTTTTTIKTAITDNCRRVGSWY